MSNLSTFRPFLESERISLREVRLEDANETYYRWMNDPETIRCLESRFYPNSLEGLREHITQKLQDRNNVYFAIILKEGGRHIGNVKLGPINWIHRRGDIGILIGEKDLWGKGYATETIKLVVGYAFQEINLHKLTASCCDHCQGSAKAFQKAGFTIEGCRKQHMYWKGGYTDEILLGLVRPEEFPDLTGKHPR